MNAKHATSDSDSTNWREDYLNMKAGLSKRQIELLEKGPDSLSSSWLLGAMHSDWKRMKGIKPDPEPPDCSSSFKEWEQRVKDQGI